MVFGAKVSDGDVL